MQTLLRSTGAPISTKRATLAALLALGTSLSAISSANANPMMPGGQPPAPMAGQQAPGQGQQDDSQNEVQQILAKYGEFVRHEKYGDVWKPTQVAQGWRPYEPCHWTYNQEMRSWFFDDKTEWGSIVHHYGRWTLDQQQGWLWVPGSEFGPGWVAWEMRGNEVGWAPLPPEQEAALVQTAEFKGDPNLWTFVALNALGKGCAGSAPPPPMPQRAMAPPMPGPGPAPMPAVGGGYVSGGGGGYVTGGGGGYVGGGYVGGYVPGRIIIVNGCWSHPKWCSFWPGKNWHPHWPKPGHVHPWPFPKPHPMPHPHPKPGDNAGPGPKKPGPDQACGIAGQFCKPGTKPGGQAGQMPGPNPGGQAGPKPGQHPGQHPGQKPGQQAGPKPGPLTTCHASWCKPGGLAGKITPKPHPLLGQHRFPHRPLVTHNRFQNRFAQNRFAMHQPRINHRPMHFQQRSFAPRQSFTPRQNFAPRQSFAPRQNFAPRQQMASRSFGGGARMGGGNFRRR